VSSSLEPARTLRDIPTSNSSRAESPNEADSNSLSRPRRFCLRLIFECWRCAATTRTRASRLLNLAHLPTSNPSVYSLGLRTSNDRCGMTGFVAGGRVWNFKTGAHTNGRGGIRQSRRGENEARNAAGASMAIAPQPGEHDRETDRASILEGYTPRESRATRDPLTKWVSSRLDDRVKN